MVWLISRGHSSGDEHYLVGVGGLSLLARVRFAPIIMLILVGTFERALGTPCGSNQDLLPSELREYVPCVQVAHNLLCTVTYHTTKCLDLMPGDDYKIHITHT